MVCSFFIMAHIQINFQIEDIELREILIAQLSEEGYHGFEENENLLHAFIEEDLYNNLIIKNLASNHSLVYTMDRVEMRNWNSEWESSFEPVQVMHQDGTIWANIRAPFHDAKSDARYDLLIQPKMSFGTGHHATTALMVEGMSELDFLEKSVIDFGSGTGILSILAEKMGAKQVLAIDCDDWSIENARENIAINTCNKIQISKTDQFPIRQKADFILANINLNVILDNLQDILQSTQGGGLVLFSGIMHEDENKLIAALQTNKIDNVIVRRKGDWSMLMVRGTSV